MYHQTLVSHLPIISAARDPPGTPQQRVTYMDTMSRGQSSMTIWTGVDPAVHQMNVAWLEVSVRLEQCSMYIQSLTKPVIFHIVYGRC